MQLFTQKFGKLSLCLFTVLAFLSCQKNLDFVTVESQGPDLFTKVTSSVSGFVTNENNTAVLGAEVKAGGHTVTTDKYGFFEIKNIQVVKNAAVVVVTQAGYFKGIKTYIADDNKAAFFRIKLIPKTNSGSINASSGGNVTLSNGLIVALPADAVVNASSNAAYTGVVNIASHWIDPTATDLNQTMPGDLRGIATDGSIKTLTTYGMAAVELTGASGELLQIAPGKKATLTLNIPSALSGSAPASIPLWSFDETNGLWKQEGTATKTGNTYVGEVSHFSFWNCDLPANYVQFNCTVKDQGGNPIPYMMVKISVVGSPYNAGYGWTDSSGYVGGAVPGNASLLMEVIGYYSCNTPIYTQNFTTASSNVSLGDIIINTSLGTATVKGAVYDCANNHVTNGYLIVLENGLYSRYNLNDTGAFNFSRLICNNSAVVSIFAEDLNSGQQSTASTYTLVTGLNNIGYLQACGVSSAEFITYSINGTPNVELTSPPDSLYHSNAGGTGTFTYISGHQTFGSNNISFQFDNTGIGVGSTQVINSMYVTGVPQNATINIAPVVNITEYGAVGEFIAGNLVAHLSDTGGNVYDVFVTFRLRRTF